MSDDYSTYFLDTNVLLSPLRSDCKVKVEELILALYPFKDRIVIPGHVHTEFYNNIETIYKRSKTIIKETKDRISQGFDLIISQLSMLDNDYRFDIQTLRDKTIVDIEGSISGRIKVLRNDAKRLNACLQDIFVKQTYGIYSIKEIYVLMAEYDARCKRGIAPGFKDSGKDNCNDYGDLLIWHEILDYMNKESKDGECDAIFITNDDKADWRGPRSKNQLQAEYNEYVYDGTFTVMSYGEFREAHRSSIDSFVTKYMEISSLIGKKTWSRDDFLDFMCLIEEMDLSLSFFLVMLSEESKVALNRLVQPYKLELLALELKFLSLSLRGQAAVTNSGLNSIQELFDCSIAQLSKTRSFGKMSLSEVCEKSSNFITLFGPFDSKLEKYTFEGYSSLKNRVSFN